MVRSVLLLDDDAETLDEYARLLRPRSVFATGDIATALETPAKETIDLALVDLWLGNQWLPPSIHAPASRHLPGQGLDVTRELRFRYLTLKIVLITEGYAQAYRAAARNAGADGVLPKMLGAAKIIAIVEGDALSSEPAETGPMSLARKEHEYVAETFLGCDRNASQAGRVLKIPRSSVHRKLRRPTPP